MNLIHIKSGEYPVTIEEFRHRFLHIQPPGTPDGYRKYGYAVVWPTPQPDTTETQYAEEDQPERNINGVWRQTWIVKDYTPEELAKIAEAEAIAAASIAAKEELALDQIHKKTYAEVEGYIRGTVTNLATAVDLLVKMGKLIKALVER